MNIGPALAWAITLAVVALVLLGSAFVGWRTNRARFVTFYGGPYDGETRMMPLVSLCGYRLTHLGIDDAEGVCHVYKIKGRRANYVLQSSTPTPL